MSQDRGEGTWAKTTLAAASVMQMIRQSGGPSLNAAQMMNMTPRDYAIWKQINYGHLPQSHQAGNIAEELAHIWLKREGCTNIIAIQNASNHGLDLVYRDARGEWMVAEVKGHIAEGAARLRGMAKGGPVDFAKSVIERVNAGEGAWGGISKETRAAARALEDYLKRGKTLQGWVINVEHVLDGLGVVITKTLWRKL